MFAMSASHWWSLRSQRITQLLEEEEKKDGKEEEEAEDVGVVAVYRKSRTKRCPVRPIDSANS